MIAPVLKTVRRSADMSLAWANPRTPMHNRTTIGPRAAPASCPPGCPAHPSGRCRRRWGGRRDTAAPAGKQPWSRNLRRRILYRDPALCKARQVSDRHCAHELQRLRRAGHRACVDAPGLQLIEVFASSDPTLIYTQPHRRSIVICRKNLPPVVRPILPDGVDQSAQVTVFILLISRFLVLVLLTSAKP